MKNRFLLLSLVAIVFLFQGVVVAAPYADGFNCGTVIYLLNNQPGRTVSYSLTGCLYTKAGVPEYFDTEGTIASGNCIAVLSKNTDIVGGLTLPDGSQKKSHIIVHFYEGNTDFRLKLDGVNDLKNKSVSMLLNAVEQNFLYPYDNTWVWNTNNDRLDINFGPITMTRSKRVSSLTPQLTLNNALPTDYGNKQLAGRSPIALVYFPVSAEIIGSITCYYYKPDHSVTIIDSPNFFENICNTSGAYFTNTGQPMVNSK